MCGCDDDDDGGWRYPSGDVLSGLDFEGADEEMGKRSGSASTDVSAWRERETERAAESVSVEARVWKLDVEGPAGAEEDDCEGNEGRRCCGKGGRG